MRGSVMFDLARPDTLDAAKQMLATPGAVVLAGGQSLVPLLSQRAIAPRLVIDISRIDDLRRVAWDGDVLRIGAMATLSGVLKSEAMQSFPLLAAGIASTANPGVRNRATLVGNLVRANALGELSTVAVALAGRLLIESAKDRRVVAAQDFFLSHFRSAVAADEIVVSVEFPAPASPHRGAGFSEITHRAGIPPMVCVAANLEADAGGTIVRARIAAGGVQDRPVRCLRNEAALTGMPWDKAEGAITSEDIVPAGTLRHASYASEVLPVVIRRAVNQAVAILKASL